MRNEEVGQGVLRIRVITMPRVTGVSGICVIVSPQCVGYHKEYLVSTALPSSCNMCTCSGNGTQERAVQDLLCLVDLYLVYLI